MNDVLRLECDWYEEYEEYGESVLEGVLEGV